MLDTAEVYLRLREAIGTGEVVGIIYHGGSQPGAYREIIPLQIVERQLRAKCRMSNKAKVFNLDKIAIQSGPPEAGEAAAIWSVNAPTVAEVSSVAEVEAAHRAGLMGIGWHVVCVTDEHGDRLCLHRWTKDRSRPLKNPAVSLRYTPLTSDFELDALGVYRPVRQRPNSRPWSVAGGSATAGGPWKFASKALEAFLREASAF